VVFFTEHAIRFVWQVLPCKTFRLLRRHVSCLHICTMLGRKKRLQNRHGTLNGTTGVVSPGWHTDSASQPASQPGTSNRERSRDAAQEPRLVAGERADRFTQHRCWSRKALAFPPLHSQSSRKPFHSSKRRTTGVQRPAPGSSLRSSGREKREESVTRTSACC